MKSSLAHHVLLTPRSAAVYLGVDINYTELVSLAELDRIDKLQRALGNHAAMWFGGPTAQRDPCLAHTNPDLLLIFKMAVLHPDHEDWDNLTLLFNTEFRKSCITLGVALEGVRQIASKFFHITGNLSYLADRLSALGFFELC